MFKALFRVCISLRIRKNLKLKQLQGKELSYNNYNDIFSCIDLIKILPENIGTAIVKHANPCGVSVENNHMKSYLSAVNCDPISAYGGVLACNYKISFNLYLQNCFSSIIPLFKW